MSFTNRKGLLDVVSLCLQARRFRGKINIQKPRKPHYEKALLLEVTKPYFIKSEQSKLKDLLCDKDVAKVNTPKDVQNPLQMIYAKELLDKFKTSKLIAFYHKNSMPAEAEFNAYSAFHKINMEYKTYGLKTVEMAIKGTQYEAILELYVSQNAMVFSTEPEIKKLLKVNKKYPQLILLAAIYEGRFISKDELVKLSSIPNLEYARLELVQTLNNIAMQLLSHLGTNQQVLVSQLTERTKQLCDSDSSKESE